MIKKRTIKKMFIHSPIKYSQRLDNLLRLTLLKKWINQHQPCPYFETRELLYEHLAKKVIGNRPITFLEFGVYLGGSMRSWTSLNTEIQSEFIGFDSFEGLPEAWVNVSTTLTKGSFSTNGQVPIINDIRVKIMKGWFNDTLPKFLAKFSTDKKMIIHLDADIYPSTMYTLCNLDSYILPGTIIIFDDFSSMLHDFRALEDYTCSYNRKYEVIGAAGQSFYKHVAIRFIN
jgi:O-methyltransferase